MIALIFFELKIHRLQRLMILILKKPIARKLVSVQTVNAKCGVYGSLVDGLTGLIDGALPGFLRSLIKLIVQKASAGVAPL
jgi:hypothetical protein